MTMAFFDSTISRFHIDDTAGVSHDLSTSITEIEGIPGSRSMIEVTSLSDDGYTYVGGAPHSTIRLAGIFDDGSDAVLVALLSHSSAVEFSYAPVGASPGDVKYSGRCWLEMYEVSSSAGDRVGFTATLRVDGSIVRGIY